jgi:magnesium chelatase subunit H
LPALDRPEDEILSLPRIIANSIGRDIDEIYTNNDKGFLEDVQLLQDITLATRDAVAALVQAQADADGRVSKVSKLNFLNMGKKEPWIEAMHQLGLHQGRPPSTETPVRVPGILPPANRCR